MEERAGELSVEPASSPESVSESVRRAVDRGETVLVAAGGDGTVGLLVNAVMRLDDPSVVALGAVGLGSSNDFHKPAAARSVEGIPLRLDCAGARPTDVIRIDLEATDGRPRTLYAIINASVGITAEANARFNAPTRFVSAARKLSVDAGIVASVLSELASYRDIEARLTLDGGVLGEFPVSNLSVIKNPHFGGSFCYDTPVEPDDGVLGVNLCEGLTPFQAVVTLAALSRRRFRGRPKTRFWTGRRLTVATNRAFALEADGEVVHALGAEFSVVPRAIRCCR